MNVIEKMTEDHWPNLVVLKEGYWFVASEILEEYERWGKCWVEFLATESGSDDFIKHKLKEEKNLRMDCCRQITVNTEEIMFIAEYDS